MPDRIVKINKLLKEQLGQTIKEEIEFPLGTIITITKISTAKDLRQAHVYISVLPDEQMHKVMKILIKSANQLQKVLNKKIVLRNIPKLRFHLDEEEKRAMEIDELLNNLK